jgi:peptidoglycan hydrolase-like protein with peptidoglycan-binding domain
MRILTTYPGFILKNGKLNSGHVKWIQARLNLARHGNLLVDGDFGDETEGVVTTFQRIHHLEQDGKVGRNTWRALNAVR